MASVMGISGGGQRVLAASPLSGAEWLHRCIEEKNIVVDLLFIKVDQRLLLLFNAARRARP